MNWTYQQVIDEADELYPNSLTPESKLRKIYLRERELFRTIYRKKTAFKMDIVAGQPLYPLDFHKSKIIHVIVNGKRYDYEEIDNEEGQPPFLYTYENSIGIYPTPETDVSEGMFVFHYFEPSEPQLAEAIKFDPDYPMVLVYSLCKNLAEIARKFDEASGFAVQYNDILEDFKRANPEPELPPMRVE